MGVTTIDDDVALLEVGCELGNEVVDCGTGLDEEDDLPRCLELLAKLLDGVGALDLGAWGTRSQRSGSRRLRRGLSSLTFCLILQKVVDLAGRTVVCDDGEALVVHVEDQVLTLGTS